MNVIYKVEKWDDEGKIYQVYFKDMQDALKWLENNPNSGYSKCFIHEIKTNEEIVGNDKTRISRS